MRSNRRTIEAFVKKVVTARPTESLAAVARLMEQHHIGAVIIVEHDRPTGILTDRDLALLLGARGVAPQTEVKSVMKQPVRVAYWDDGVFDVTEVMMEHRVRRVPVVDDKEELIGLVTLDDLLRVLSQEFANLAQSARSDMEVK